MAMTKYTIVLGGQSNQYMGPLPAPNYPNAAGIYRYSQPWNSALAMPVNPADPGAGSWSIAVEPIHSDPLAGAGPGMAIADQLLTLDPTGEPGLVPCALGGSGIESQWYRGLDNKGLFSTMVARGLAAAASWGPIRAFVWYQGEADSLTTSNGYWRQSVYDMIMRLRQHWGNDFIIVIVRLGPNPGAPYVGWASMQNMQAAMAGILPRLIVVDASDLAAQPSVPYHLTTVSMETLGRRIANAIWIAEGNAMPSQGGWLTGPRNITVTATAGLLNSNNDPQTLVDGSVANNVGGSCWFPGAVPVAGKYIDFAFPSPIIIDGMRWRQWAGDSHINDSHGTWQASIYDGATWVNLGSAFTLGGQPAQEILFEGNGTSCLNFRLTGISGMTSGYPYLNEVEFRSPAD